MNKEIFMESNTIGENILNQLKMIRVVWDSWNVQKGVFFTSGKDLFGEEVEHKGGVRIQVKTKDYVGWIVIALAPNDTFIIRFGAFDKDNFLLDPDMKKFDDIYFDELHESIDDQIFII